MGGGTGRTTGISSRRRGLSPRGRGNLRQRYDSMPANGRVYPRVGGGTGRMRCAGFGPGIGLSPRGRGNHVTCSPLRGSCALRSIPAWAGEPDSQSPLLPGLRSIPAWAGESKCFPAALPCQRIPGLSPRGRGNRNSDLKTVATGRQQVYPRVGGGTSLS